MRLEGMTAELRPRSDWEAVDLGLALVRRDFWRLFCCWGIGMSPVLALSMVFLRSAPVLLVFACWWWMPVASRMVLFVLSRRLFGELPTWKDILREWPRATIRRFGFRMLWARFSPWRPLTMPVEDLEGLRGKAYETRVRVLLRRGDSTVIMLALWRGMLTFWLGLALFSTVVMFLPEAEAERWNITMDTWTVESWFELPSILSAMGVVSALLSMALVDVFSTGAGFGIYVNHRTWIEGWDVELAFRRLGNRLRSMSGVALSLMFLIFTPISVDAALSPKEVIEEVKSAEEFIVHTETYKVPNPRSGSGSSFGSSGMLAGLGVAVFWVVVAAIVGTIIWILWKFRHAFRGASLPRLSNVPAAKARVVMGMEVAPDSLPEDIPQRALELWGVGRRQEAMSLLYRGAISRLIETDGVEISESDTERDCLRRVSDAAQSHVGYFTGLTDAWMRLAYARHAPEEEQMQQLCATWPFTAERGKA